MWAYSCATNSFRIPSCLFSMILHLAGQWRHWNTYCGSFIQILDDHGTHGWEKWSERMLFWPIPFQFWVPMSPIWERILPSCENSPAKIQGWFHHSVLRYRPDISAPKCLLPVHSGGIANTLSLVFNDVSCTSPHMRTPICILFFWNERRPYSPC